MRYIIVDLEATCWENVRDFARMETIEIGAVELPDAKSPPSREFSAFIRPVVEPQLSEFCQRLTSIRQEDVDRADDFGSVFPGFVAWIGPEPFVLCSWGGYDLTQFRIDCERHGVPLPSTFLRHINLKKEFARQLRVKVCGMQRALSHAGLPLIGTHHRGIDDARNIARLAALVLPGVSMAGESAEESGTG
ncbi:MAG TPA: 3'-5' exonuclease [Tepidisphaeraceae bacterium]|nr:3'-5' exonuclease [Tepidisphaeraceae bacterium]